MMRRSFLILAEGRTKGRGAGWNRWWAASAAFRPEIPWGRDHASEVNARSENDIPFWRAPAVARMLPAFVLPRSAFGSRGISLSQWPQKGAGSTPKHDSIRVHWCSFVVKRPCVWLRLCRTRPFCGNSVCSRLPLANQFAPGGGAPGVPVVRDRRNPASLVG
jgi:hypothetical protein